MRIPPIHRPTLSALSAATAIALVLFSVPLLAQTAPLASPANATSESQSAATGTVHTLSDDRTSGTLPTAADIQKQGERTPEPADAAPSSSAVLGTSAKNAPPPPVAIQPAPEPAKYDVTLIGHRNIGSGLNFYSLEREIAVGQDLAKQVEQTSKLVTDPEITSYVNRIAQNLVRNSDARVPFTIKVIDSDEINAFALPGGFFYVDSGLILAADSEAELAAIMAHEIAHVAARHATKNMTKQQIWTMASIPLMFVGGPAGYAIAEIANIVVPMSFLKFSRDSEREADMLGLQYDYAAGYDPQAFIQFFERLKSQEKQKHNKIAKMFSTHPMTADRITSAQNEIQTYLPNRDNYVVDTSDFESIKARLLSLEGNHRLDSNKSGIRPNLRKHTDDQAPPADTSPSAPAAGSKPD